jgi:hypothetical protein
MSFENAQDALLDRLSVGYSLAGTLARRGVCGRLQTGSKSACPSTRNWKIPV